MHHTIKGIYLKNTFYDVLMYSEIFEVKILIQRIVKNI